MQHCSTSNNNLSLSTVTSRLASAMIRRGNYQKSAFVHTHFSPAPLPWHSLKRLHNKYVNTHMCPGLPQAPPTTRKPLESVVQNEGRSEACLRQAHAPTCSQTRLRQVRSTHSSYR